MRHFFRAPLAPGALASRVAARPAQAALVASAGAAQRLATAQPRTLTRAVDVAVIAVATDAYLAAATAAVVQPHRSLREGSASLLPGCSRPSPHKLAIVSL